MNNRVCGEQSLEVQIHWVEQQLRKRTTHYANSILYGRRKGIDIVEQARTDLAVLEAVLHTLKELELKQEEERYEQEKCAMGGFVAGELGAS